MIPETRIHTLKLGSPRIWGLRYRLRAYFGLHARVQALRLGFRFILNLPNPTFCRFLLEGPSKIVGFGRL